MHAIPIKANTFIPTKGCDTNALKMREYHLHLIKIPSHLCAKTSYNILLVLFLASCPGSRGGGERKPGTHRLCMRLIIQTFVVFCVIDDCPQLCHVII